MPECQSPRVHLQHRTGGTTRLYRICRARECKNAEQTHVEEVTSPIRPAARATRAPRPGRRCSAHQLYSTREFVVGGCYLHFGRRHSWLLRLNTEVL